MPLYEYHCPVCDKTAEVQASMADAPPSSCPLCQQRQKPLVKIFSRVAAIRKGGAAEAQEAPSSGTKTEKPAHVHSPYCNH